MHAMNRWCCLAVGVLTLWRGGLVFAQAPDFAGIDGKPSAQTQTAVGDQAQPADAVKIAALAQRVEELEAALDKARGTATSACGHGYYGYDAIVKRLQTRVDQMVPELALANAQANGSDQPVTSWRTGFEITGVAKRLWVIPTVTVSFSYKYKYGAWFNEMKDGQFVYDGNGILKRKFDWAIYDAHETEDFTLSRKEYETLLTCTK